MVYDSIVHFRSEFKVTILIPFWTTVSGIQIKKMVVWIYLSNYGLSSPKFRYHYKWTICELDLFVHLNTGLVRLSDPTVFKQYALQFLLTTKKGLGFDAQQTIRLLVGIFMLRKTKLFQILVALLVLGCLKALWCSQKQANDGLGVQRGSEYQIGPEFESLGQFRYSNTRLF